MLPHLKIRSIHLVYISLKVITVVATHYEFILCNFCRPEKKVQHHFTSKKCEFALLVGLQAPEVTL